MTTLNDIKAAITESIDPLEGILDDLADMDPMVIYSDDVQIIIEDLETIVEHLDQVRDMVKDLIG